jgi:hypothetical protein
MAATPAPSPSPRNAPQKGNPAPLPTAEPQPPGSPADDSGALVGGWLSAVGIAALLVLAAVAVVTTRRREHRTAGDPAAPKPAAVFGEAAEQRTPSPTAGRSPLPAVYPMVDPPTFSGPGRGGPTFADPRSSAPQHSSLESDTTWPCPAVGAERTDSSSVVVRLRRRLEPTEETSVADRLREVVVDWPTREEHSIFSADVVRRLDLLTARSAEPDAVDGLLLLVDDIEAYWVGVGLRPARAYWPVTHLVRTLQPLSPLTEDRAALLAGTLDAVWAGAIPTEDEVSDRHELGRRLERLPIRARRSQVVGLHQQQRRAAEVQAGQLLAALGRISRIWSSPRPIDLRDLHDLSEPRGLGRERRRS